jgi:hypothetical protein
LHVRKRGRFPARRKPQKPLISLARDAMMPPRLPTKIREEPKEFGRSMCPHLFRDSVITTVASQMPEHVRMGMHLLGNRDQGCVADHYDQSLRVVADNKYNAALDAWEDAA